MRRQPDRTFVGFRLDNAVVQRVKAAAHALRKTQGAVVQEALGDYFERHRIGETTYQLHVTDQNFVLMRVDLEDHSTVVEVMQRNGVTAEKVAEEYGKKLRSLVRLVQPPMKT
jgi:tRNA isopentenyl-2-thiomethyl-A-37 hydroxylase MiaE